jgi:hypothetical protein
LSPNFDFQKDASKAQRCGHTNALAEQNGSLLQSRTT